MKKIEKYNLGIILEVFRAAKLILGIRLALSSKPMDRGGG